MNKIASLIRPLVNSPETAEAYWLARNRFAADLATRLISAAALSRAQKTPILYAVWLHGHREPIYLGQSSNGCRRLWDLPIGESHHLANTFPPESWHSVAVLQWADLIEPQLDELLSRVSAQFALDRSAALAISGLGFEFLFLEKLKPLFNLRKRRRDGSLRQINLATSQSLGARALPICTEFAEPLLESWERLASGAQPHANTALKIIV